MNNFWRACLACFEKELPPQQYKTWIKPLQFHADGDRLLLVAPNRFVLQWIRDRFLARIEQLAREHFRREVAVQLSLAEKEARAAATQVAERPGAAYNPLFIYGGVGLGKTHLIQAIGNRLREQAPETKIRYIHAEQYVSDVVRAYQHKAFDDFKRYYHSLDLLLIDDIQFFGGNSRKQEEFFYAFNALIESHKQVVITCDTYPKEIAGIENRLISRFGWGLTVAVEPPELEMRVAILLKKAEAEGVKL